MPKKKKKDELKCQQTDLHVFAKEFSWLKKYFDLGLSFVTLEGNSG